MSLLAWYPLSGDLNDYSGNGNHLAFAGGSGISLSATGKTGKAYYKNPIDNTSYLESKYNIDLYGDFSMSCWTNIEASSHPGGLISLHNHNNNTGIGINACSTSGKYAFAPSIGYGDSREYNLKLSDIQDLNKWIHITMTYKKETKTLKIFINGILNKTFTLTKDIVFESMKLGIFAWSMSYVTSLHYRIQGKIQNVKIYDHTLSLKEVKNDYKTKVLEYKFDKFSETTINLVKNGTFTDGLTNWFAVGATASIENDPLISNVPYLKINRTGTGFDGVRSSTRIPCKAGVKYTLSLEYFLPVPTTQSIRVYCPENKLVNNVETLINYRHYISVMPSDKTGVWKKLETTWSTDELADSFRAIQIDWLNVASAANSCVYIRNVQLEESDHMTPIVEGGRISQIIDSSGLNNHATVPSSITHPRWIDESPFGMGSYIFNNNYFNIENNFLIQDNMHQEWSVVAWINIDQNTTGVTQYLLHGLNLGVSPIYGSAIKGILYINNGVNDAYKYTLENMVLGSWLHVVYTFNQDNNSIKIYINGIDMTGNGPGISSKTPAGISNTFKLGHLFKGKIANFEMYATSLTLADAKELYHTKGSIDKNNIIYASHISEATEYNTLKPEDNLIKNGNVDMGDNTNFPGFSFIAEDSEIKMPCFQTWDGAQEFRSDEYIPIDKFSVYEICGYFKSIGTTGLSRLYIGLRCFDSEFKEIPHHSVYNRPASRTTLAKPINKGDTVVTLTELTDWSTTPEHTRYLGVYNQEGYDGYDYTRNVVTYTSINTTDKTITLKAPWGGTTVPAGTKVANTYSGSTFLYPTITTVPSKWTKYIGKLSGWGLENGTKFRPGTRYVKVCMLLSYQQPAGYQLRLTNISLRNISTGQINKLDKVNFNISKKSIMETKEINNVGPVDGLHFWSDLEYDNIYDMGKYNHTMAKTGTFEKLQTPRGKSIIKLGNNDNIKYVSMGRCTDCVAVSGGINNEAFTMHASIYPTDSQKSESIIVGRAGNHNGILMTGTTIICQIHTSGGRRQIGYDLTANGLNKWHSVTITYSLKKIKLYINGVLQREYDIGSHTLNVYSNDYLIGGGPWETARYTFKGGITNIRIYNKELDSKDIQILHNLFMNNRFSIEKSGVIYCNDVYER